MPALIGDIGFHAALMFMALAAIVGLVAGVMMLTRPDVLAIAGKYVNRWVSTRKIDRTLERWFSLDRWFYEHHRISGGLMLAGAIWTAWYFALSFDLDTHRLAVTLSRGNYGAAQAAEILLDSFRLVCMASAIFAVVFSFILFWRPGLLRDFQAGANEWLSLRRTLKPVEVQRAGVDEYVAQHTRLAGALLLLGALYILAGLLSAVR